MNMLNIRPPLVPKPHQVESFEFLLSNKRAFNLSRMGTGKTLPAVQAIDALYRHKAVQRVLVVAPISVVRTTWVDHFERVAPDVPLFLLDDNKTRKKEVERLGAGVVLINPDGLPGVFHEILAWKPELIVVDELSGYYRNCRTRRWKALAMIDHVCKPAVWGFTGTPLSNGLCDAYAQILLVNPDALPKYRSGKPISWLEFRDMFHIQPYPNVWTPKEGALERVYGMMQPAIRYTREEVMQDVAEAVRVRKTIPLTDDQKKLMRDLEATGKAQYGDALIKGAAAQAVITKIVQIMTGAVYDDKKNVIEIPAETRVNAMFDLWDEIEHTPLIVCVPFVHTAQRLKEIVAKRGYRVENVYGDVNVSARTRIFDAFQRGEIDFLVCHPKTMAHGITLHASHTVLWFAALYDLELYEQANARIERYGQKDKPLIVEFCGSSAEANIYAALHRKEKLQGKFLDFFK